MMDSIRTIASNFQVDVQQWQAFFEENGGRRKRLIAGYLHFIEDMASRGLPPIFEGSHLGKLLGTTPVEFARLTGDPEHHYRSFTIPKRSGGERTILAPTPLLLHCQRWVDAFILRKLPTHSAAHGYVVGQSNITNARVHIGSAQVLCLDISNFFESVGVKKITEIFYEAGYPPNVAFLLARLCSYMGHLPQGGASSPQLSNIVMRDFDATMQTFAEKRGLRFSRYVDDIALSGDRVSNQDIQAVEEALEETGLTLNPHKIRFQRGRKKIVTGISIGSGRMLLPRELRRRFRNQAFLALKNLADAVDADPIALERHLGRFAYWKSVEPDNKRVQIVFDRLNALKNMHLKSGNPLSKEDDFSS